MALERFAGTPNQGITTLDGALSDSATTIPVASMADLKLTGLTGTDFAYCKITKIGNWRQHPINRKEAFEIVKVTAVSGNDLTAVRGADSTNGTAFTDGDIVEVVFVSIHYQHLVDALTDGLKELNVGKLGVGTAPIDAIHVSGASGGITVTETDSAFDAVKISSGVSSGTIDVFISAVIKQVHLAGNGNCWVNSNNGNFGVRTDDPTLPFDMNAKIGFTSIGGYAIKLTNKTGGNTVKGELVVASTSTDDAFDTAGPNDESVIGVVLEAGVADGEEAWVVTGGKGEVLMDSGGCTHGDRIGTGGTAGSAAQLTTPSLAEHFKEIGHSFQTVGSGALARTDLHFN